MIRSAKTIENASEFTIHNQFRTFFGDVPGVFSAGALRWLDF